MRVVVADDAALLREGLALLLQRAGLEVAGLAGSAEELYPLVDRCRPDVVVVDIRMPPTYTDEGLQAARTIRLRWPGTGILVLSQYVRPATPWSCCPAAPEGSATCSRNASLTWANCHRPSSGSPPGARCWTPRSWNS